MLALMQDIVELVNLSNHTTSPLTYQCSFLFSRIVNGASVAVKAQVWIWIIDETLVLTSMLSVCRLNEVGTCQVMEQVMIMVMMVMTTR